MTLDQLKKNLALHGADLSLWPLAGVKPALALIERSPDARQLFDEAERLDGVLRQYQPVNADMAQLASRIMKATHAMPQGLEMPAQPAPFFQQLFVPGSGLLMAAVMGFFIGLAPMGSWDNDLYTPEDQIIGGISTEI